MNILITGGSGFLGHHLIKYLLPKHKLTIYDRQPLPETSLKDKLTFIKGDVRDFALISKTVQGQDLIIHSAASLPLETPHQITTTTVQGTENVLKAAQAQKTKRVIYVSSTAVYGVPIKHPIEESDPLVGVGAYGHAKIDAEKLCRQYRETGMTVPIIRPKTFIGTERLGVFQILYNWVRLGKRIPIIGDGQNRYQLLEVEDLVKGIWLLATKPQTKVNTEFNIGAAKFGTVNQDVGALCEYANTGARVLHTPAWAVKSTLRVLEAFNLSPLYKWVYDTADKDSFVSIDRIKKLGWKPSRSNAEALINSYQWYLDHYQEVESQTGTHHRVGWNQGALGLIKKFL